MRKLWIAPVLSGLVVTALAATTLTALASAEPGPALTTPVSQLDAALECSGDLSKATRDPVLLTPAFSTADQSYGWNYRRELPKAGIPTCSLTLPDHGFGDLQTAAEYDVRAIRRMSAESGRREALLGHQHGALDGLWALKFWPDLPARVSDFISLATPYHGTALGPPIKPLLCDAAHLCTPSLWQIMEGSRFLAALNRAPLPAGPAYTSIATAYDELIFPQPATSTLAGAQNIQLQDICPLRPVEHFSILGDALGYRLVLDALANPGPANPARISRLTCFGPLFMPGVLNPLDIPRYIGQLTGVLAGALSGLAGQNVGTEPPVRAYAAG